MNMPLIIIGYLVIAFLAWMYVVAAQYVHLHYDFPETVVLALIWPILILKTVYTTIRKFIKAA